MSTTPTLIAIAVVEHEDRFLIGLRPEGVALAGYWEFPGGKVEPDESAEDAARRECLEETGVEVAVGEPYPDVVHQYDHGKVHLRFFACRAIASAQVHADRFRWVRRDELANYEFPPANAGLLNYLLARSGE